MSSRRSRVKAAPILAARKTTKNDSNVIPVTDTIDNEMLNDEEISAGKIITNPQPIETDASSSQNSEIETIENQDVEKVPIKNNVNIRRRIKPSVNIPTRRSKATPINEVPKLKNDVKPAVDENVIILEVEALSADGDDLTISNDKENLENNDKSKNVSKQTASRPNVEEEVLRPPIPEGLIDDSIFKSPQNYLSSRYNSAQKPVSQFNNEITPLTTSTVESSSRDDFSKCPLSPTKVRQRIKPVPLLGHRRNSLQNEGNKNIIRGAFDLTETTEKTTTIAFNSSVDSVVSVKSNTAKKRKGREDGDEIPRRQRHLSSSSSHSNQSYNINYKHLNSPGFVNSNRHRTESSCSNASDLSIVKEVVGTIKPPRRFFRSEESYRLMEAKKDFYDRFPLEAPEKTQLKMIDMIYYNPQTNPMKSTSIKEEKRPSAASSVSSFATKKEKSVTPIPTNNKSEENVMPVPQLKIGPNGDIIIDEKSLVIETTGEKEARETLANTDIVYDDEFSGTQGFYKRKQRTRDWGQYETLKFYRCLHTLGTDFSMMEQLFPHRTRRDIKLKFKREEKTNLNLVNKALLHPKKFSLEQLELELKADDEKIKKKLEMEKMKALEINKLHEKRIEKRKQNINSWQKKSVSNNISQYSRMLTDGEFIFEHEKSLIVTTRTSKRIQHNYVKNALENIQKHGSTLKSAINDSTSKEKIEQTQENKEMKKSDNDSDGYHPNLSSLDVSSDQNIKDVNKLPSFNFVTPKSVKKCKEFNVLVNNDGNSYLMNEVSLHNNSSKQDQSNISQISLSASTAEKIIDDNLNLSTLEDSFGTDSNCVIQCIDLSTDCTLHDISMDPEKEKLPSQNRTIHNLDDSSGIGQIVSMSLDTVNNIDDSMSSIRTEESIESNKTVTYHKTHFDLSHNMNHSHLKGYDKPNNSTEDLLRVLNGSTSSIELEVNNEHDVRDKKTNIRINEDNKKNTELVELQSIKRKKTIIDEVSRKLKKMHTSYSSSCDGIESGDDMSVSQLTDISNSNAGYTEIDESSHQSNSSFLTTDSQSNLEFFKTEKTVSSTSGNENGKIKKEDEKRKSLSNRKTNDRNENGECNESLQSNSSRYDSDVLNDSKVRKKEDVKMIVSPIPASNLPPALVAVAIEDPNNPSKTIYEIYTMCRVSGRLSEKPLDLPDDVIQAIAEQVIP